jgi:MFS family permease
LDGGGEERDAQRRLVTPPDQRGRLIGAYATMIGLTLVVGPALLAWLGDGSPYALWVVIGFLVLGLAWTALVPRTPPAQDADSAKVGLAGLWHAVAAHPVIMLAGFVGGFFELGLASILPLYGLTLGLPAAAATLLVSVSGLGGMLLAFPAGMLIDRLADPEHGRRTMMLAHAASWDAQAHAAEIDAAGAGRGRQRDIAVVALTRIRDQPTSYRDPGLVAAFALAEIAARFHKRVIAEHHPAVFWQKVLDRVGVHAR